MLRQVFFGFDNFLIAYAGRLLKPAEYMSMMFLAIFCVAALGSSLVACTCPSFKEEARDLWKASRMQRFWIVASGALIALAQTSACMSFSLDEVDSGPLQSIVIANVPIVGIFFYFWSNETLSKIQLLGCASIMGGITCMFWNDSPEESSGFDNSSSSSFTSSFAWICISTLFYALSIITIRFAGEEELPERPKSLAIVLSSGFLGFVVLRFSLCGKLLFALHLEVLMWASLNAVASMLGLLSVVLSYEVPEAKMALATALIDSNAVPMCGLNFVLLGAVPGTSKLVGMALVLLGCAAGFMGPKPDEMPPVQKLSDLLLEGSMDGRRLSTRQGHG